MLALPSAAKGRVGLRLVLGKAHLYIGLVVGLIFAVLGLSGSALVFLDDLTQLEFGELIAAPAGSEPAAQPPIDAWIETVRREHPEIAGIDLVLAPNAAPFRAGTPLVLGVPRSPGRLPGWIVVVVDGATNRLRGAFRNSESWSLLPMYLHTMLAIPAVGDTVVALSALCLLLALGSGIYLWWPRTRPAFRRLMRLEASLRGGALWRNVHVVVASYCVVFLIVMAATGVYLIRPYWVSPVVAAFSPVRPLSPAAYQSSAQGACGMATSPEQALRLARAEYPEKHFGALLIGLDPDRPYLVSLRAAGDRDRRLGDTNVIVDRHCPRILAARTGAQLSAGEQFVKSLKPLHADLAMGTPGVWIVFLSGLALPVLYVSGAAYWVLRTLRVRRNSQQQASRISARGPVG